MARKKQVVELANCSNNQLMELANNGNQEALLLLKKHYREKPGLRKAYGDLSYSAQESRLRQMLKDKEGYKLAVREKMQEMIGNIAGDNPAPLEVLLAERIVMCWFDVQDNEHRYAELGNDTLARYEWRSRMLDRAHNRYLSAIKILAFVRKVGAQAIQVNIADKQINTIGTSIPNEKKTDFGNPMDE